MKAFAITLKGLENIASLEIKEITGSKVEISKDSKGIVIFEVSSVEQIAEVAYKSQSISRTGIFLDNIEFSDLEDLSEKIKNIPNISENKLKEFLDLNKSFNVECERSGKHDFKSTEAALEIGKLLPLKNPDFKTPVNRFFAYVHENKLFFGIDFSGFEMDKRSFNVFMNPDQLKAPINYALVREAGFSDGKISLDPLCRSGLIPIESALYASNMSPRFYDKENLAFLKLKCFSEMDTDELFEKWDSGIKKKINGKINCFDFSQRNVKAAEKNSKIAGVNKLINFSRVELNDLDLKFEDGSIDCIVTYPPQPSLHTAETRMNAIYSEFFNQAKTLLSKKGKLCVALKKPELFLKTAKNHDFKISKEYSVMQGQQEVRIVVLVRD
ncbi:methyltransferase [Nanoarchaeota archaeon]